MAVFHVPVSLGARSPQQRVSEPEHDQMGQNLAGGATRNSLGTPFSHLNATRATSARVLDLTRSSMSFQFDHWEIETGIFSAESAHFSKKKIPPQPSPPKRVVKFKNSISVILIPCRQEYYEAGIDLWFHCTDQEHAQKQVVEEVKSIMYDHPKIDIQTAMTYLFQPKNEDEFCTRHSRQLPDVRERMNVLVVHPSGEAFEVVKQAMKRTLAQYERWVIAVTRATSCEEAIDTIKSSVGPVAGLDVVIIHESILLQSSAVRSDHLLEQLRSLHGHTAISGLLIEDRVPGPQPTPPHTGRKRVDSLGSIVFALPEVSATEALGPDLKSDSLDITSPRTDREQTSSPVVSVSEAEVSLEDSETLDSWACSPTHGLADQPRHASFCVSPGKDPIETILHDKARENELDFLWREPLLEIVHILPLLIKSRDGRRRRVTRSSSDNAYMLTSTRSPDTHAHKSPRLSEMPERTLPFPVVAPLPLAPGSTCR